MTNEDDLQLRRLVAALKRSLVYIVLAGALVGISTYSAVAYFMPKEYASSATLILGRPFGQDPQAKIEVDDVTLNQKLVGTYGELVKSRAVLNQAIDSSALPLTYDQLKKMTSVKLVNDTEIIGVRVEAQEPELAAKAANAIASAFMVEVQRTMNIDNVRIVDEAIPISSPVGPPKIKYSAIASLVAMMLVAFAAALRSVLDSSVRNAEELRSAVDLPLLAVIPSGRGK